MDNEPNTSMDIMKKAINAVRNFLNSRVFDGEAKEKINELKSALDSFKGDPVVQEILAALPALEYLITIFKSGLAIKDRFYLKKIVRFVKAIQDGKISEKEMDEHRKKLEKDNGDKEIETVLLVLERLNDEMKAEYLGKFYLAFLKGLIVWDEFCELAEVTDRMIMVDYKVLMRIYEYGPETDMNKLNYKYDRLVSLGLFGDLNRAGGIIMLTEEDNKFVDLTDLGRAYCEIICDKYDSLKARRSPNRDFTVISKITKDDIDNILNV